MPDNMDAEPYTIAIDARNCMLRIVMNGFWGADDVRAFVAEEQAAAAALPCARNGHLTLADLSGFSLQSQEVVTMCEAFIRGAGLKARRLALVGGNGLAWIQIKRMIVRDNVVAFDDVASAERWLLTGDDALVADVHDRFRTKAATAAASIRTRRGTR